ncbi:hypothetical protein [Bradyrhizobium iriomotense]|uniref:hypothetical protein n=1 Tax=Bradyrhizobium iriomotense TaxID=441950 RepID=UPI001B8A31FB|nr:hypothetical protein [Bradyrhizobium iriomotense]MBR1128409.1 hypothetical protein [Bradyrhizobium iriomotense]
MNLQERIAHIDRAQKETRKFAAEQRAPIAKDAQPLWPFPIGGMVAGAALFGAGMACAKLLGT